MVKVCGNLPNEAYCMEEIGGKLDQESLKNSSSVRQTVGRIAIFILKRALYERNTLISFQIYGILISS